MKNKTSQSVRIYNHLVKGKSLTAIEALKKMGIRITTTTKHNRKTGKKFACYSI
jgi:hypothetical protein